MIQRVLGLVAGVSSVRYLMDVEADDEILVVSVKNDVLTRIAVEVIVCYQMAHVVEDEETFDKR